MARAESKMIMGYLPIEERHYPALFSLVAPASPAVKLLDPFAGEGAFLDAAAQAWGMTPYANELDGARAEACIARFGPTQALRCDAERLVASNNAFGVLWANPPYDHDTQDTGSKRVEFRLLRHAWKWAQEGGIVFWVVYRQHLTESAAAFLAKHSRSVDVWALPGKHLNTYDQIVVVAIKGEQAESGALYQQIMAAKADPRPLTVQPEPVYRAPMPRPLARFVFAPDLIDAAQGETLIQSQGAWQTAGFQALLEVPQPPHRFNRSSRRVRDIWRWCSQRVLPMVRSSRQRITDRLPCAARRAKSSRLRGSRSKPIPLIPTAKSRKRPSG